MLAEQLKSLTIYECPACGRRDLEQFWAGHNDAGEGRTFTRCDGEPVAVRYARMPLARVVADDSELTVDDGLGP